MRYFQTDDRDDYFFILKNKGDKKSGLVSLIDTNGNQVFSEVQTHVIRNYVKTKYPEFGNAKKIWRSAIESKGYKVVNENIKAI